MAERSLVSLFSGGGGLDYGLALAGFATRLAVEQERYACKVLRDSKALQRQLPNGHGYLQGCEVWEGDIARLSDGEAVRLAGLEKGEASLLVGGPPCVTFSVAGRREGLTSETGQLYRHFVRLLKAFEPKAFIFENVKGLLTAQGAEPDQPSAFRVIRDELEGAGYAINWALVDAADYGVPQHRYRVIVLGGRGDVAPSFPAVTHADPKKLGLFEGSEPWQTVRDAFRGLPSAVELGQTPSLLSHVAKRHSDRMKESYAATPPGRRNLTSMRDRLRWDEPGKTVRAQGKLKADGSGQKNSSHQAIHPDEPRQLTPRECARIQTFPDWYPFPPSLVNAYRIIGDAVPCRLAYVLGKAIGEQIDERSTSVVSVAV